MRKKEANPYRPAKPIEPPYLTQQQISEFYNQFTLLGNEISIKKITETVNSQNWSKSDKVVNIFFEQLKSNKLEDNKKGDYSINFHEYFSKMINFFVENNENNEIIMDLLADEKGKVTKETIKEVLQDTLGRKIYPPEFAFIMEELKKESFLDDKLRRTKIEEESES